MVNGLDAIIKHRILIVKNTDPVLAKMLQKFYQKNIEFDGVAESIVKHVMTADKGTKTFDVPLDSYILRSINHFRVISIYLKYKNSNLLLYFNHCF